METPESARAWAGEVAIPTYEREPDSPHPPFLQGIYPYTVFGKTGKTRRSHTYQALFLENRYLLLTILPELGGRVISVLEKWSGREVFYHNHVVKPGDVDARHAWISGGLEFSFPIAHNLSGLEPLDFAWQNHPDGSASVYFGETERLYRMKWLIELKLPPDRSLVEVSIRLYNPTPFRHRWQFWSNAAVYATPGLQFIYPLKYAWIHGGDRQIIAWPSYKGKDISWYRNNESPIGTFGKEAQTDFFGAYDHDEDAGVVHWADHREVPGKKSWTWGTCPSALAWATVLSDEDGPYCEIQSGRYETQGEFSWLRPRQVQQWQEFWYPVSGIGGFCHAGKDGAISLKRESEGLEVGVCLNREISGGRLILMSDESTLYERPVELGPGQPLHEMLPGPCPKGPVCARILDEGGNEILAYTCAPPEPTDPEELERQNISPTSSEPQSAEDFYLQGISQEKLGNPSGAMRSYSKALAQSPEHTGALAAQGILALKARELTRAMKLLSDAVSRDPDASEARYYLALAFRYQGMLDQAEAELWHLVRAGSMEEVAWAQLGELAILRGEFDSARRLFNRALLRNPEDGRSIVLLSLCMRKLEKPVEAGMGLEIALRLDRLDSLAECELCFLQSGALCHESPGFTSLASRLNRTPSSWLELSLAYSELGLLEEAAFLLERAICSDEPKVTRDPMIRYHLADLLIRLGDQNAAAEIAASAEELSPEYVFPYCAESIPVLERALSRNPEASRAAYYLGNLYHARGRTEEAIEIWERSAALDSGFPVVHRNLGLACWKWLGRHEDAIAHYERAIAVDPQDLTLVVELDQLYAEVEPTAHRRRPLLEEALAAYPAYDGIAERLAAYLLDVDDAQAALDLLIGRRFGIRHESAGRQALYTRARIALGEQAFAQGDCATAKMHFDAALEFPDTLGEDQPLVKSNPVVEEWLRRLAE